MKKKIRQIIAITALLIQSLLGKPSPPNVSAPFMKNKPNPALKRTISLDVGYLPSLNSNRAMGEFDFELRQAWGGAYDYFHKIYQPTTLLGGVFLYGLFNFATWGPTMGQMATYHELGHATRFRAIGIDTSFINIGKAAWGVYIKEGESLTLEDVLSDEYFPTVGGTVLVNAVLPAAFLLSAVMPRYDRSVLFKPRNEDNYYHPAALRLFKMIFSERLNEPYDSKKDKDLILFEDFIMRTLQENMFAPVTDVLMNAGGLNNQQDQCRRVEDNLWYSAGDHFATVGTYFWDKTWAGFQSLSCLNGGYQDGQDTSRICNAYRRMGVYLTHEEIIKYSYLSYFLSAQTYANIYQIYKTLTGEENKVYAAEYGNIKLPNVGLYFTSKGPTYKVSLGYRYGENWFFPVGIEFGLKESIWELMIGLRKKFPNFHDSFVHAEVVFNSAAAGGSVYGGVIWNQAWNIQAGFTYHNAKTFQGERNITSYKDGDTDIETWLKVGIVY